MLLALHDLCLLSFLCLSYQHTFGSRLRVKADAVRPQQPSGRPLSCGKRQVNLRGRVWGWEDAEAERQGSKEKQAVMR